MCNKHSTSRLHNEEVLSMQVGLLLQQKLSVMSHHLRVLAHIIYRIWTKTSLTFATFVLRAQLDFLCKNLMYRKFVKDLFGRKSLSKLFLRFGIKLLY